MTRQRYEEIEKQLKGSEDTNFFCGLLLNAANPNIAPRLWAKETL